MTFLQYYVFESDFVSYIFFLYFFLNTAKIVDKKMFL
jgi:hypothetical protein